jgi:parallel beta-helix repeat protein
MCEKGTPPSHKPWCPMSGNSPQRSIVVKNTLKLTLLICLFLLVSKSSAHGLSCGETVTGTIILTANLICPSTHGLRMGEGATLDCGGHHIIGSDVTGQYGIYVRGVSQVLVQNCVVEHFEVGIRLRGSTNSTLQGNTLQHNTRYGLEITGGSRGAMVRGNTVYNNSDEGIHVSGPSNGDAGHSLLENTLDNNSLEGIYLLNSSANVVANNTISNHGAAGIYLSGSARNRIESNYLNNDPVQLISGSHSNELTDITIVGQRLKLDGASGNTMKRFSIQEQGGRPSNAYDLNNASNNEIIDSEAIEPVDFHIRAADGSKNNIFTHFLAVPALQCFVDKQSNVVVTDALGEALPCGHGGDPGGGREKQCKDGIDNDGDTFIDCADPDCRGKAGCK